MLNQFKMKKVDAIDRQKAQEELDAILNSTDDRQKSMLSSINRREKSVSVADTITHEEKAEIDRKHKFKLLKNVLDTIVEDEKESDRLMEILCNEIEKPEKPNSSRCFD